MAFADVGGGLIKSSIHIFGGQFRSFYSRPRAASRDCYEVICMSLAFTRAWPFVLQAEGGTAERCELVLAPITKTPFALAQ
jgi:hypothetical protein